MTLDIDAIFDNGVFRPLAPLVIPDGTRVHLRVDDANGAPMTSNAPAADSVRAELDEFRRLMAELPIEGAKDGFSGADHDRILYRKPTNQ